MDLISIILSATALVFALLAHIRISKESARTDNDFASYNRRVKAACDLYDDLHESLSILTTDFEQWKKREDDEQFQAQNIREWMQGIGERLNSIEERLQPASKTVTSHEKLGSTFEPADPADEVTMTSEFRLHIEKTLVLNAIHCQQSVRDWMHECQWNIFVNSRGVKEELARIMQLIAKYPGGYWRDVYSQYEYPQWIRDIFNTDAPKDPDAGVKAIMTRLYNWKKREGIDVQELKPFPTAYKG